jgi:hypothetical protein
MLVTMRQRQLEILAIAGFAAWCVLIEALLKLPSRGNDFPAFYTVAQAPWSRIYDLDYFIRYQEELRRAWKPEMVQPFPRAPIYALLLRPFGLLGYSTAVHLWLGLMALGLVGCAWLLRRLYGGGWEILFCMIGFYPVSFALTMGQDSALVLGPLLLALLFHRQGRDGVAAFFLSLAFQKFHILLLVPLALLLHGKGRLLWRFAAWAGFWAVLNVALVGPAGLRSYLQVINAGIVDHFFVRSWNLRSFAFHFGWGKPGYVLGALLVAAWFAWLARRLRFETAFWCGVSLSLLLAWHSFKYDWVLAFPFFYLLWRQYRVWLAGVCLFGGLWVHAFTLGRQTWILAPLLVGLSVLLWRKAGIPGVARHMTPTPAVAGVPEGPN